MAMLQTATATILVTDLVASTHLRVSVGEQRADALRRELDAVLGDAAASHGGTVVKGLGDGLLVLFPGAAEAVAAGVAMQQAAHALGRRESVALEVRVGLSSGDVSLEHGDCFGTPVVEASRLCAVAAGGEILIADVVKVLSRGRGDHRFEPRGPLELKGLPEPVNAFAVAWEPAAGAGSLRGAAPYVGRERERGVLRDLYGLTKRGTGRTALVAGEPGIGKTRLVSEVCREVAADGATVLWGGCHDGDVTAYAPFVEIITSWARGVGPEGAADALGTEATVLASLAPAIRSVVGDVAEPAVLTPDEASVRVHDAVCQWLGRLAATAPVVLVVDDLHWGDDASIRLLRAVARAATRMQVLVLVTYRETDLDRSHPLAEALPLLRREVEPTRLSLDGLDDGEVQDLLQRMAGHDVPVGFASLIAGECDGNPFFIRETILHLAEEGRIRQEDGVWVADRPNDLGIPEGIREVLGRRLARLSATANKLLAIGALFEVRFPLAVVAEVADVEEDVALDAVDEALAAQIVRATDEFDSYAFTHALFRHTLVAELNPSRQVRYHRAIADALEKRLRGEPTPQQAATLVRHFHRSAAIPGADRGIPYALVAAADAEVRVAFREAYDLYVVARELLEPGDDRELAIQRGVATNAVLCQVPVDDQVAEAERLGQLAQALVGDDTAADEVTELAMNATWLDDVTVAWRLAAVARRWLDADRRDATWVRVRACELAEQDFSDPEGAGLALDTPERRELRDVALSLPTDVALPTIQGTATDSHELALVRLEIETEPWDQAMLYFAGIDYRAAAELVEGLYDQELAMGRVSGAVVSCAIACRLRLMLGDHDRADEMLQRGVALLPRVSEHSNAAFQLMACFSFQMWARGEQLSIGVIRDDAIDDPNTKWAGMAVRAAQAHGAGSDGDIDGMRAALDDVVVAIERAAGWAPNYPLIVFLAVGGLWWAERTDFLDRIESHAWAKVIEPDNRYCETDPRWLAARICSLRGRHEEAREWFDQARVVLEGLDARTLLVALDYDVALAELRAGAEAGDVGRGRSHVESARAGCCHPAMAAWLPRLDELDRRLSGGS